MARQDLDKIIIRLPDGMRGRIKTIAASNNRSMNAEIVATLEEKYPPPASAPVMPAPDTLVDDGNGGRIAAMFYYAVEGQPLVVIAAEHGFLCRSVDLFDTAELDDPDVERYTDDPDAFIREWQPEIPEGWTLGGKFDCEDGPFAMFLRKREA